MTREHLLDRASINEQNWAGAPGKEEPAKLCNKIIRHACDHGMTFANVMEAFKMAKTIMNEEMTNEPISSDYKEVGESVAEAELREVEEHD